MQIWRRLLWPFSLLYGAVMWVRNYLYDHDMLESFSFPVALISVGNLTTGGTGKTPHIEYLIRLLETEYQVATLSRGYGRKTKGFILVSSHSTTEMIGDEPSQYFTKFKNIQVSVGEDRVSAIDQLLHLPRKPHVILMDDAFQHRRVKPGLNILMVEYDSMFKTDFLLPAGNLREGISGMKRADIIIISKTPAILVTIERKRILEKLQTTAEQKVFFSYLKYGEFIRVSGRQDGMQMGVGYYLEKRFTILLVTGIANPSGLIEYLRRHTDKLESLIFPDHHEFSLNDISKIRETFNNIANPGKIILTTEKDAMRLRNPELEQAIYSLPLFYIPIEVAFHQEEEQFNTIIKDYVRKNQANSRIHTRQN